MDCATEYANPVPTVMVPAFPKVKEVEDVVLYKSPLTPDVPDCPEEPDEPVNPDDPDVPD
jgi:hypothetical protein